MTCGSSASSIAAESSDRARVPSWTWVRSASRASRAACSGSSVTFSRWLVLRQAAWYLFRFAVLWLVLWVPSQQAFFLGGAYDCAGNVGLDAYDDVGQRAVRSIGERVLIVDLVDGIRRDESGTDDLFQF